MSTSLVDQVVENFYTHAEAVRVLGITKPTLWRWVRKGKVKAYKLGREVLIEKKEIDALR